MQYPRSSVDFALTVCLLGLCPESVQIFAQANSELMGIVTDQSGAVVAGASIVLTDPETGLSKTTESGERGLYVLPGLNPASYRLKVAAKGFQSFDQTGIVVNVSSTTRVDVKLPSAETQTITVTTDALAVQQTRKSSRLINSDQIRDIAPEIRTFLGLATLALGVSSAGRTTIQLQRSGPLGFSANGPARVITSGLSTGRRG